MNRTNLYKGSLSTIILKLLSDKGKMYGYQITREIEKITDGDLVITEGALYPILHKLEAQGLLSVELVKVKNRTRKYYLLTKKGENEKTDLIKEMKLYLQQMNVLIHPKLT